MIDKLEFSSLGDDPQWPLKLTPKFIFEIFQKFKKSQRFVILLYKSKKEREREKKMQETIRFVQLSTVTH